MLIAIKLCAAFEIVMLSVNIYIYIYIYTYIYIHIHKLVFSIEIIKCYILHKEISNDANCHNAECQLGFNDTQQSNNYNNKTLSNDADFCYAVCHICF
jgi:hypothetical protein